MSAGMDDILEVGLQGPIIGDRRLVRQLDRRFETTDRHRRSAERELIVIARDGDRGNAGEGEGDSAAVSRPTVDRSFERQSGVGVKIDGIAVACGRHASRKETEAAVVVAPQRLIDDPIKRRIGGVLHRRRAGLRGEQSIQRIKALIREAARVKPGPNLQGAGEVSARRARLGGWLRRRGRSRALLL